MRTSKMVLILTEVEQAAPKKQCIMLCNGENCRAEPENAENGDQITICKFLTSITNLDRPSQDFFISIRI